MLCNTICTMKGCRFSGGLFPSLDERGESMQHEIMKAIPLLDENGNLSYNFKYGREYGTEDMTTVFVPISRRYVSKENLSRLEALVPYSYSAINKIME